MRIPKKSTTPSTEVQPQPILIRCAKCLCEFERDKVRKYPSIGGNTLAFVLCSRCADGLASTYGIEPHEMGALTMVLSIEREQRDRARSEIRYGYKGEQRDRLIRSLDVSLATAHNKTERVHDGARSLAVLMAEFALGDRTPEHIATWAGEYRAAWRRDHALNDDLQNLFGFGESVQAGNEMAVL